MIYVMYCPKCHQSFSVRGTEERDTNAFIPHEDDFAEHQRALDCDHDDAYVTNVEDDN